MSFKADDINLLVPSFRPVVTRILDDLRAAGHSPVPRDTLRTRSEALVNASKGTGIADSMHLYGVACDIICGKHGWGCREAGCAFYTALGKVARGYPEVVWGGTWKRNGKGPDLPHIQCVTVGEQPMVRDLARKGGLDAVEAFVSRKLRKYQPRARSWKRALDEECR